MLKRPFARFAAVIATISLAGLAGCNSDNISGPSNGSFSANVSGTGVTTTLSGNAEVLFFPATTTGTTTPAGYVIGLLSSGGPIIEFQLSNLATLTAGTYPVSPGTLDVLFATVPGGTAGSRYAGDSGSMTITRVSGNTVTGTFNCTVTASDVGSTLTLTGTFTAVQV